MGGALPGVHQRAGDGLEEAVLAGVPDDGLAAEVRQVVAGAAAGVQL